MLVLLLRRSLIDVPVGITSSPTTLSGPVLILILPPGKDVVFGGGVLANVSPLWLSIDV